MNDKEISDDRYSSPPSAIVEPHATNDVVFSSSSEKEGERGDIELDADGGGGIMWLENEDYRGNLVFRHLLEERATEYAGKTRLERPLFALQILKQWRSQQPPGRFLQQQQHTNSQQPLWYDVGDKKAQRRISKALQHFTQATRGKPTSNTEEKYNEMELLPSVHEEKQEVYSPTTLKSSIKIDNDLSLKFANMKKGLSGGLGPRRISKSIKWNVQVGTMYGRTSEQQQLVDIYEERRKQHRLQQRQREKLRKQSELEGPTERSHYSLPSRPLDFVFITGVTGTGKTSLALSLKHHIESLHEQTDEEKSFFIQTKFEQLSSPDPNEAFLAACSDFCRQLGQRYGGSDNPTVLKQYAKTILHALNGEHHVLSNLVPELQRILKMCCTNAELGFGEGEDCATGALVGKRVKYALRSFFQAIASVAENPIVFFIDDLHWAHEGSLDILAYLFTDVNNQGILFLTTYLQTHDHYDKVHREGKNVPLCQDSYHRLFQSRIALSDESRVKKHNVELSPLSVDAVESMLSATLSIESTKIEKLRDTIFSLTKGNALFIMEVLRSLQANDVLRFDETTNQWICENMEVLDALDVGNLHDLFQKKILDLPKAAQETMKLAAFLGSQAIDESLLMKVSSVPTGSHLNIAISNGLLSRRQKVWGEGEMITFTHDGIQGAAYTLVPLEDREAYHLQIGHELWQKCDKDEVYLYVDVIAHHCVLGQRCLKNMDDRASVALLCLQAGEKAAQQSSFQNACKYLLYGVQLLEGEGSRVWRGHYELCLRLHNAAAEMCYCNAELDKLSSLFETVLSNARNFDDTVQIRSVQIYSLGSANQVEEAIEIGVSTLRGLGENIPLKPSITRAVLSAWKTYRLLRRYSDEAILRLPIAEDTRVKKVLLVMNHICVYCYYSNPMLALYVTPKMVRLTLKYGLTPVSSAGLSYFSLFVRRIGSLDEAYRIGKLALKVHSHFNSDVWLSRVTVAHFGVLAMWKEPVQNTLEPLKHAYRIGLTTGDIEFAMINASIYCWAISTMLPLPRVHEEIRKVCSQMEFFGQEAVQLVLATIWQRIQNLMGLYKERPTILIGDALDESQVSNMTPQNSIVVLWIECHRMYLSYMFGDYDDAEQKSQNVHKIYSSPYASGCEAADAVLFKSMTLLAQARRKKVKRIMYISIVRKLLKMLKKWAFVCPENFSGKQYLLEAELAAVLGKHQRASLKYRSAILHLRESHLMSEEGLANERLGKHYVDLGQIEAAVPFLQTAYKIYVKWGGVEKARHLKGEMEEQSIVLGAHWHKTMDGFS